MAIMKLELLLLLTAIATLPANFLYAQAKLPIPNQPDIASIQPQMDEVAKTIIAQHPKGSDAAVKAIIAIGATETDPAKKYAVLQVALKTAIESALAASAFTTIESIESAFEVEHYLIRFDMIKRILPKIDAESEKLSLLGLMLEAARDASQAQDYDVAQEACGLVVRNLPTAQRKEALPCVTQMRESIQFRKSLDINHAEAVKRLHEAPDDPDANTIVGKYTFFMLDNLQQALPHFAKSKVPDLESIAALEDQAAPSKDQLRSLADLWWNVSAKELHKYRMSAIKRAAFWYSTLVDELNGVEKAVALSRIEASYQSERTPFIRHNLMRPRTHQVVVNGAINDAQETLSLSPSVNSHCQFVVATTDNYDIEYHFMRTGGRWGLAFTFPFHNRSFSWHHGGAEKREGWFVASPQANVKNAGPLEITDGKPHVLLLKIRTNRFQCFLDGTLVSEVRDPLDPNIAQANDPTQPYLEVRDYWANLTVTKAILTDFH